MKKTLVAPIAIDFPPGTKARISAAHPLYAGQVCTVTSRPSPASAIVVLELGEREYISVKFLEKLQEETKGGMASEMLPPKLISMSSAPSVAPDSTGMQSTRSLAESLTPDEERQLHHLERKVERAFYEAGKALTQIRDRKLYRATHKTFEAYCKDRFGFTRRRPYQMIDAAAVVDNLCTNGTQNRDELEMCTNGTQNQDELEMRTNGTQILPTNERQVRDLIGLEPDEQREAWQQAVNLADGKIPSGKVVKGVVERLKEKPRIELNQFCQVGDVFTLTRLEGVERKYNGCSCVVSELKDFTVMVDTYHQTIAVKPDNLKRIDSPDARRELPQVLERIRRLRSRPHFLDRGAYAILEHLGKQLYLTPLEDKALQLLEREYGTLDDHQ